MCRLNISRFACGHFRVGYQLCAQITTEEVQWIQESNNDFMTIINNCQYFTGQKTMRARESACSDRCQLAYAKAKSHGWRCCDCSLRHSAQEDICACGHSFCGISCYALGPDEKAIMTGPYETSITHPMEIRPVKRWGSFTNNVRCYRWSINSSCSDKSS